MKSFSLFITDTTKVFREVNKMAAHKMQLDVYVAAKRFEAFIWQSFNKLFHETLFMCRGGNIISFQSTSKSSRILGSPDLRSDVVQSFST